MVWGLVEPMGFGDFFPKGSYVGWDELLYGYFNNYMLPEFKAQFASGRDATYANYVGHKYQYELGRIVDGWPPIQPMLEHEWPTEFKIEKSCNSLGSLMELNDRVPTVDEALKDIIEKLEPGVHSFHPIVISMPKGVVYPKRYYTMVIGRFLHSFDPQKSEPGSWEGDPNHYRAFDTTKNYLEGLALSKGVFADGHLWRERKLRSPSMFISDALQSEIAKAGLRIFKHYRLKEV